MRLIPRGYTQSHLPWRAPRELTFNSMPRMPDHAGRYLPNMSFALLGSGATTTINLVNYYDEILFGHDYASPAIAEITVFDADGGTLGETRETMQPHGSLHLDIAEHLGRQAQASRTVASVYCRIVPTTEPSSLPKTHISTEYVTEIRTPGGSRTLFHNTLGPTFVPSFGLTESGQLFADRHTATRTLVLANNYLGPRIPFLSSGRARVNILNARGDRRSAYSGAVPYRGIRLFSLGEHFPDLTEFLDGAPGVIDLRTCNLLRKPWVLLESPDETGATSVEHL